MTLSKQIKAREFARKDVDYWTKTNELNLKRGDDPYSLEYMLTHAWKKGYEAGQRATRANRPNETLLTNEVEKLCQLAGTDTGETIDWLTGDHGGMAKLFSVYFGSQNKSIAK